VGNPTIKWIYGIWQMNGSLACAFDARISNEMSPVPNAACQHLSKHIRGRHRRTVVRPALSSHRAFGVFTGMSTIAESSSTATISLWINCPALALFLNHNSIPRMIKCREKFAESSR
jgi:hypothetical protein